MNSVIILSEICIVEAFLTDQESPVSDSGVAILRDLLIDGGGNLRTAFLTSLGRMSRRSSCLAGLASIVTPFQLGQY